MSFHLNISPIIYMNCSLLPCSSAINQDEQFPPQQWSAFHRFFIIWRILINYSINFTKLYFSQRQITIRLPAACRQPVPNPSCLNQRTAESQKCIIRNCNSLLPITMDQVTEVIVKRKSYQNFPYINLEVNISKLCCCSVHIQLL